MHNYLCSNICYHLHLHFEIMITSLVHLAFFHTISVSAESVLMQILMRVTNMSIIILASENIYIYIMQINNVHGFYLT